jgi:hypothetical protein
LFFGAGKFGQDAQFTVCVLNDGSAKSFGEGYFGELGHEEPLPTRSTTKRFPEIIENLHNDVHSCSAGDANTTNISKYSVWQ